MNAAKTIKKTCPHLEKESMLQKQKNNKKICKNQP
jgi:hypothetical protein